MRVTFPAVLDAFACSDQRCACRNSLRAAAAVSAATTDKFPFRDAELAMIAGADPARAADKASAVQAADLGDRFGDYPVVAIATPDGVELSFASLCPTVQALFARNVEPIALARAEGGWRVGLRVFHHADKLREVRLSPRRTLPWAEFAAFRESVLDLVAEPTLPLLARLARVAGLVDLLVSERSAPGLVPPLTARGFLAFRGFVESRVASAEPESLAEFAARTHAFWGPNVRLQSSEVPGLLDALGADWRGQLRTWVVPVERRLGPVLEAWLGARLFATPLDRDLSIARGYSELFEGFAVALRFAAALGEVRQAPVDENGIAAALALGEHLVASEGAPLPAFELPRDLHDKGPRMADLDMTLESIC